VTSPPAPRVARGLFLFVVLTAWMAGDRPTSAQQSPGSQPLTAPPFDPVVALEDTARQVSPNRWRDIARVLQGAGVSAR